MVSLRLIVGDLDVAVAFYVDVLAFEREAQTPVFAAVVKGDIKLLLSTTRSAGGKPLTDGSVPAPGGWNRLMLTVVDVKAEIMRLAALGVRFRGEPVTGPAGTFAILDDPSGNPIELWQPAAH